jgi:RNA polymerase sigma-70 factor (ECF subfamily)
VPEPGAGLTDAAVEQAFRAEAGAALATVARLTGDLDLAEEAVQEAFVVALRRWPTTGAPDRPGAWITTTARNRAIDGLRHEGRRAVREQQAGAALRALEETPPILHPVADDQMQMLFTCCHPALDPDSRVALTLRLVSGLRTAEIARLLLVGEPGVAKRIQRAKQKIRTTNIPLRVPPPELLGERVPSVLECVYLTFTEGYAATAGPALVRPELCDEAVRLARLLATLLPDEPGPDALLALLLLQDGRRDGRFDAAGQVVLLEDQDRATWDHERIEEGLGWLRRAEAHPALSAGAASYLLQAALAAEHARAPTWEQTDWARIVGHYDQLVALTGSPVVALNRAVAVSHADGPAVARPLLLELSGDRRLAGSAALAIALADVHRRLGEHEAAAVHYREALAAGGSEPEQALLRRRLAEAESSTQG